MRWFEAAVGRQRGGDDLRRLGFSAEPNAAAAELAEVRRVHAGQRRAQLPGPELGGLRLPHGQWSRSLVARIHYGAGEVREVPVHGRTRPRLADAPDNTVARANG